MTENPDKQYNVISTSTMINKMTVSGVAECVSCLHDQNFSKLKLCVVQVNGEPRKDHHKGKWEQVVQKAPRSLQEMLRAASQRRRNVIIDQVGRHVGVLVWVCCALSSAVLNINITPTNRRIFVPDQFGRNLQPSKV